jgi:hypothetical protein
MQNERLFWLIINIWRSIMAAIDDLKASVNRLNSSTSAELKAIADKLANLGSGATDAEIEGVVAQINATADQLDAETAALAPPAPKPAP